MRNLTKKNYRKLHNVNRKFVGCARLVNLDVISWMSSDGNRCLVFKISTHLHRHTHTVTHTQSGKREWLHEWFSANLSSFSLILTHYLSLSFFVSSWCYHKNCNIFKWLMHSLLIHIHIHNNPDWIAVSLRKSIRIRLASLACCHISVCAKLFVCPALFMPDA